MGTDGGVHRDAAEGEAEETLSARNGVHSPVNRTRYAAARLLERLEHHQQCDHQNGALITTPL